ncbi:peptide chain release factor N(5)-glutamine methyltransferase [Schleiferilactobacillus shenzhenensis]|uniref:Release factor glutamine methyltransferase n=1 Tax=Schleiferilactobacillus shenzhenensis LY-73 TaxID=1231336 RepID=U4TSL3_9LACO|nr:peptide chain release factor N(5)-glutamine methyltransferase [Schleiferilactobacillus shenzhenensis]ERL66415.1 HemK [Schleiferilactobacillus shenzhenensis LY-73]
MASPETYNDWLRRVRGALSAKGLDPGGAEYVLTARQHWTNTDLLLHLRNTISTSLAAQLARDAQRLLAAEPAQYIVGQAWFAGLPLHVAPGVLIPRPETEELVAWLLDSLPANAPVRIADIGTGSGAIAIAVAHARPRWQVTATDVSPRALEVAQANADRLVPRRITFRQGSLLAPLGDQRFTAIISNPPYISWDELAVMDRSVKQYEPSTALFAPDHGLAMYQALIRTAPAHLAPDGQLFLEHGYRQRTALTALFAADAAWHVQTKNDLAGQPRMVRAVYAVDSVRKEG